MPLTELDNTAALVLIDLQKGIVGRTLAHPAQQIVGRAAQLATAFREQKLPVVLVNVTGRAPGRTDASAANSQFPDDWTQLVPELDAGSHDHLVSKQRWGAFLGTDLNEYLRSKGVTQIFFGGIATTFGVESTARSAYDLGYNVVLVSDAMTDMDMDAHTYAIEKLFPRLGQVDTTDSIIRKLEQRK